MSRCNLELRPLYLEILQHFVCHVFKLSIKFKRNGVIQGGVINDLARFRRAISGVGGAVFPNVRGPNCTELGDDIERSFLHNKFVLSFRYFAAFSNAYGSKLSDVENNAKFGTF